MNNALPSLTSRLTASLLWGPAALSLLAHTAAASPPPVTAPAPDETTTAATSADTGLFGFMNGLARSSSALGDLWGVRSALSRWGMSLGIAETSEVLGNATGGIRQNADYDGLTQAVLQLDTQRAFGWYGGTFDISALQIHGRNLSADALSTLQTASGIEADRATRLWEFWFQQKLLAEDRLDIRLGEQSLDQEFMGSQNASIFINTMFGWPMLPSADLPGGGSAYPLAAPGLRVRARPTDALTLLTGIFNGSPTARQGGDPQRTNASGTSFPLNGGIFAIAELQYAYPSLGTMVGADEQEPLARLYKIGVWYDSERFDDLRFDSQGRSLADPRSSLIPRTHSGDAAVYAVADRMIWRSRDEPDRTINVFLRPMGTLLGDRNLIDFSVNAGLAFHEPFAHREGDVFGLGMGFTTVGSHARGLDRDTAAFGASHYPERGGETFVEATYQYELTPWCQLQPDAQYVWDPGAGLPDPNRPAQRIGDELVLGLRTNILF